MPAQFKIATYDGEASKHIQGSVNHGDFFTQLHLPYHLVTLIFMLLCLRFTMNSNEPRRVETAYKVVTEPTRSQTHKPYGHEIKVEYLSN